MKKIFLYVLVLSQASFLCAMEAGSASRSDLESGYRADSDEQVSPESAEARQMHASAPSQPVAVLEGLRVQINELRDNTQMSLAERMSLLDAVLLGLRNLAEQVESGAARPEELFAIREQVAVMHDEFMRMRYHLEQHAEQQQGAQTMVPIAAQQPQHVGQQFAWHNMHPVIQNNHNHDVRQALRLRGHRARAGRGVIASWLAQIHAQYGQGSSFE